MANRSHANETFELKKLIEDEVKTRGEHGSNGDGSALSVPVSQTSLNVSPTDSDGDTSPTESVMSEADRELVNAVERSDERAVEECLHKQANPNVSFGPKKNRCLHLAAEKGNLNIVKLLVNAGADVNATNSERETPLHVAAGSGFPEVVEFLVMSGANINATDRESRKGRTPLHAAADRGFTKCIQILLKADADLGLKTESGDSAMTMILRLRQGPKILSDIFSERIITNDMDPNEPNCELTFNYSILISKYKPQQMSVVEDILDIQHGEQTAFLFRHPLVASFLFLKWWKVRRLFFVNIFTYLLLAFGITAYVVLALNYETGVVSDESSDSAPNSNDSPPFFMEFRISIICVVGVRILQELALFVSMRAKYFTEAEFFVKWFTLVTSLILVIQPMPGGEWAHLAAWAVLFGWAEVIFLLGRLSFFGMYTLMFYSVAFQLGKSIIFLGCIVLGFSLSFHIIFMKHKEAFANPLTAFLRTLGMMTGDFSYDEYLTGENYSISWTPHLIYLLFVLFVSIVLMNLLIGLAVSDIQGQRTEGNVIRLRKQAQYIVYLEDMVKIFSCALPCASLVRMYNSLINQEQQVTIQPSARKQNTWLPPDVVEEALAIVKARMEPTVESTLNDTHDLVQGCISAVRNLDDRIMNMEKDFNSALEEIKLLLQELQASRAGCFTSTISKVGFCSGYTYAGKSGVWCWVMRRCSAVFIFCCDGLVLTLAAELAFKSNLV